MQPVLRSEEATVTETDLISLHKRGRWSILQGPPVLGDDPIMYHQCKKFSTEEPEQTLHPVAFTNKINIGNTLWANYLRAKPKWRCGNCRGTPPDSIITTFTLLTYEETSKEMAAVTQAYYNKDEPNDYL
jgi:hypothetical protein